MQPHLKKCFEGIRSVGFGENLLILSMISSEGETIPFLSKIDPKGKNVEMWMNEVRWLPTAQLALLYPHARVSEPSSVCACVLSLGSIVGVV